MSKLIFSRKTIFPFAWILFFFISKNMNASHIMGADISYKITNIAEGRYTVRVTLYRSCAGAVYGTEYLQIRTNFVSTEVPMKFVSRKDVTPVCQPPDVTTKTQTNCTGAPYVPIVNNIKGVERWVYELENYPLGKVGPAIVAWTSFCRNDEISTISPTCVGCWVQAYIQLDQINNSTVFSSPPIPYWCVNIENTYNHGAVDSFDSRYITVNGQTVIRDSLGYELYNPAIGEASTLKDAMDLLNPSVNFKPTLNRQNFLYTTNGVVVNPLTGTITCTPSQEQDAIMAMAVSEYRAVPNSNGKGYSRIKIGYVCRDIQFTVKSTCFPINSKGVLADSLKNALYVDANTIDVCGSNKTKVVFKINTPMGQNLKYNVIKTPSSNAIHNFKFTPNIVRASSTDTLFGTIEFDSTSGIGSEDFLLEVYYCNTIGIKTPSYYGLKINFRPSVYITKDTGYYCTNGKPYRIYAKGGTKFSWSPSVKIRNAKINDSLWIDVAPDSSQWYYATATEGIDETKSCTIRDSIYIVHIPKFNYSITPKVVDLCLSDSFKINITPQITDTPYTYTWTNTGGMLFDPATNVSTTSVSSPFGKVIDSRKLYVDIQSRYQCILTDSIQVNLKGVVPIATAKSARPLVCPGDTTMLTVSITPKVTGPTVYNANKPETMYALIGSGLTYPTGCVSSTPSTCYPSLYGTTGAGNSSQMRIIYKKSELNAAGIYAGTIRSIAFNVLSLNVPDLDAFEIKMGRVTGTNSIPTVPMFTVYNPKSIAVNSGWNKYTLDRGFDWDGVSNIVIELSSYRATAVNATNEYYTLGSIASNEVSYRFSNTAGVKSTDLTTAFTGAGLTSSKPEIRIYTTGVDSTDVVYLNNSIWDPSYAVTKIGNPRGIATINQKDSFFVATIGTAQCFDTAGVKVKIDNTFSVKASGSKVICRQIGVPNTVNLTSVITGGSNTKIKWTCNLPNAGIPRNDSTANITVTPTTTGIFKYVVKISDLPCTATDTVVVTIDDSLKFSLKVDTPICFANNGKLKAVIPQGTTKTDFDFNWTGVTPTPPTTQDSIANLYGNPNTYSLQLVLKSNPTCKGTVTNVLTAKQYILNISMANSPILCNGGTSDSIEATTTSTQSPGPYKYTWSPGTAIDSNSKLYNKVKGTYQVTATDRITGCQGTKTFVLTEPSPLVLTLVASDVTCKGSCNGTIKAVATGGDQTNGTYIYQWTNSSFITYPTFSTINNLCPDIYSCTVTDGNGCTVTTSKQINEPSATLSTTMTKKDITKYGICDGIAYATTNGGTSPYTYQWKNPVLTHAPILAIDSSVNRCKGWAYIDIIDAKGCVVKDSIFIKDIECDMFDSLKVDKINCNGDSTGKIVVGSMDLKNLNTTLKYIYSLEKNGAVIKKDSSIGAAPPIHFVTFNNLSKGSYILNIETDKGCTSQKSIDILENPAMKISTETLNPSCFGYSDGKVKVKIEDSFAPYLIDWGNGFVNSDNIENGKAEVKTLKIKNNLGCVQNITYTLKNPDSIRAMFVDTAISCFGAMDGKGKIVVLYPAIPIVPYLYLGKVGKDQNQNSDRIVGASKGDYILNIKYKNHPLSDYCVYNLNYSIREPKPMDLTIKVDSVSCPNTSDGKIYVDVTGGTIINQSSYNYSKDGGLTYQQYRGFDGLEAKEYNIVVKDGNACITAKKVKVESPEELKINAKLVSKDSIKMGEMIQITYDKSKNYKESKIIWTPSHSLSCSDCVAPFAYPYNTSEYFVSVFYHNNCEAKSSIVVPVLPPMNIYVPNAFSPGNVDGVNDILYVYGNGIKNMTFMVFNRWGEKVFESDHVSKGWNGEYKGELQPSGIYTFFVEVTYLNNFKTSKKGTVTLLR